MEIIIPNSLSTEKSPEPSGYLKGQLLIATPLVQQTCFEKSVVYICSHTAEGAMGMLVNAVSNDITCSDLLEQLNIKDAIRYLPPIHFGGPVDTSRGFILHTNDYATDNTHPINGNISLTATIDILQDIVAGKGPSKSLIALGYAGWKAGQLEEEIKGNSWICAPATDELIFGNNNPQKWGNSTRAIGMDLMKYSTVIGHA
jgi:putative transcriptional regulator